MSTSPLGPEDIRAAAEVHHELGPEYSDAVVAAFLEKVDREVAARVQARLANASDAQVTPRTNRRSLLKGVAIGLCAGAVIGGVGYVHARDAQPVMRPANHVFIGRGQQKAVPAIPKNAAPPKLPQNQV
jgi:hypothetical protein